MVPIIVILMMAVFLFGVVSNSISEVSQGGSVRYDEEVFQDYADARYLEQFGNSDYYEDNMLIVFLVDEDNYNYYYIAWVGDHIVTDISYMFGNNSTELGQAMNDCINGTNYKYSLDSDLAAVINSMTEQISQLGLESSFTCSEEHTVHSANMINNTELNLTKATVNDALEAFVDATGISTVIVVEDAVDVFGKSVSVGSFLTVAICVVVIILMVVVIVKAFRRPKNSGDEKNSNSRYKDFDDQYK